MRLLPVLLLTLTPLAACSSDAAKPSGTAAGGAGTDAASGGSVPAPTPCAPGDGDPSRTVVVRADDIVGGFGSFGTRTPSELSAGLVRISVEADSENAEPENVVVSLNGVTVAEINGVPAGTTCGVEVGLAPGHYDVTDGDQQAGFDVVG